MSEHLDLAERLFKAIEAGDIDAVREIYAPDAEIWHNTDDGVQSREENLRTLTWITTNLSDMAYTQVRRAATDDGFVQQHVLTLTNRAGQRVEVPACIVVRIADGHITRLDEYIDSAVVPRITQA
jgi:ketosteroid isomerase-like protein